MHDPGTDAVILAVRMRFLESTCMRSVLQRQLYHTYHFSSGLYISISGFISEIPSLLCINKKRRGRTGGTQTHELMPIRAMKG